MANKKSKNKGNVKLPNQEKTIKRIFFTREQLMMFLSMEDKEAGGFIVSIARYVSDGTYPSFKDHYKMLFFETTFGNALKEQLKGYEIKKNQCQQMAEQRCADISDTDTIVDDTNEDDDVVTSSDDAVPSLELEDLSFEHFMRLYVKEDSGSSRYDAKTIWNALSDDDKRNAIAYVETNIVRKMVDVSKRDYPTAFLRNYKWI